MSTHNNPELTPTGRVLVDEAHKRERLDRRIKASNTLLVVTLVVFVAFGIYLVARMASASEAAAERDYAIEIIQSKLKDVCAETPKRELARETKRTCHLAERNQLPPEIIEIQGPEGPEGPQGPQGAQGIQGPRGERGPGPTLAQVRQAVQLYCSRQPGGSCEGPGPTQQEVIAAVTEFCADGRCRGPQGEIGAEGPQGERGPAPTAEQIRAVVNEYCAEQPGGSCEGPKGEQGDEGERGPRGYTVTRAEIQEREDGCYVVFFLNDDESTEVPARVPDQFCVGQPDEEPS